MSAIARLSHAAIVFLAFLGLFLSIGCLNQHWSDDRPGEITKPRQLSPKFRGAVSSGKILPKGVDYFIDDAEHSFPWWIEGLESELTKVGAHIGPDGRLYDSKNKEIYLRVLPHGPGTPPPPRPPGAEEQEELERTRRQYEELKQRYRVIELQNPEPSPP